MLNHKNYSKDDKHYLWKGLKASYEAKHAWIYRRLGKADHCDKNLLHVNRKYQWANLSGQYKRDISDYQQLCVQCHQKMDYEKVYGNKCKNGHEYTEQNTYIRKDNPNARICKECRKKYQRRYLDAHKR